MLGKNILMMIADDSIHVLNLLLVFSKTGRPTCRITTRHEYRPAGKSFLPLVNILDIIPQFIWDHATKLTQHILDCRLSNRQY